MNLEWLEEAEGGEGSEEGAGKVGLVISLSWECILFMKAMDFFCGSTIASLSFPSAKQYASCIHQHFTHSAMLT